MTTIARHITRPVTLSFAAGVGLTTLVASVVPALAQTPTPLPAPEIEQMLEWCRQMMASVDMQAMLDACRVTMGEAGSHMRGMMSGMQGMMGGMCMIGR